MNRARFAFSLIAPVMLLSAGQAVAATAALDLPAGTLGQAIQALGRQSGSSISVPDPAIWAKPVPAIRGRIRVRDALSRLARASGARVENAGANSWRLVPNRDTPMRLALAGRPAAVPGAQFMSDSAGDDIVVTASKRDVRLSMLAGQVSRLDGADLGQTGIAGTDAILSRLSSLSSTYLGAGRNKLFIRGIADSSLTGPTQSTVGQYLGDLRLSYNAPDPDLRLYDIGSVEVLEGPQGTLYGAGSLGGIVRLEANAPQLGAHAGALSVGGSATQHGDPGGDVGAMVNLPVAGDRVAVRVVGYGIREGGYIDNIRLNDKNINRTDIYGGRATMRIALDEIWTLDLGGVAQHIHGADSQYADRDGPPLTRASAVDQGFSANYAQGSAVLSGDLGDLRFRSSTGLSRQQLDERYDASVVAGRRTPGFGASASPLVGPAISDGATRLFVQRNATRLLSSESRLWRPMMDGYGWLVGLSYADNRTRLRRSVGRIDRQVPVTGVTNRVREITLYGEGSLAPMPGLLLSAGGRLTHARLSGAATDVSPILVAARAELVAARHETTLLPSASALASILPGVGVYLRYQQGFRPGGLALEGDFVRRFRNDRVGTSELGLRLGRPADRIDLSVALSHTRWSDIQADYVDQAGLPSTANIGDGRIWSLSATGAWRPVGGLKIDLGMTWNDSRVTHPDTVFAALAQERMSRIPNVAKFAGRIGFDWTMPVAETLALRLSGWGRYVGKSRLGLGPVLGEEQGNYFDSALVARLSRGASGFSLSMTNLTDEVGNRFALGTPFAVSSGQVTPLRPRTIRLGFDTSF